jgi:hypothetical protein
MLYSQKYTLVAFLKPLEIGAEFVMTDWPLHITLADVFAIELSDAVEQNLSTLFAEQSPISLSLAEDGTLGTTKVTFFKNTSEFQNLHDKIIDLLELNGAEFNTPEFTREGFLPHSTIQKSEKLNEGDKFVVTAVSLIDMFPNSNWKQRKVLNNFNLKQT